MFCKATSANPDTSSWDVSKITDMGLCFMAPHTQGDHYKSS